VTKLLQSTPFRIVLGAIAGGIVTLVVTVSSLLLQANRELASLSRDAVQSEIADLRAYHARHGFDELAAIVGARIHDATARRYVLTNASGKVVVANLPSGLIPNSDSGLLRYEVAESGTVVTRLAIGMSQSLPDGSTLLVARDVEPQRQLTQRTQWGALLGAALLSVIGLAGAALLARSNARRMDEMARRTKAIMAGDLSQRLALEGSGDEFDRLSGHINDMLARIDELVQAMREVSDNIAHDLRTPLTRLRNHAEAALRDASSGAGHRSGLERVIEEADDLIKTFNALLLIARLESGAVEDTMQVIDLGGVVEDVSELYHPVAEEAGLSLSTAADHGLGVRANRHLLGQAIANLVDNAIKYSAGSAARPGTGLVTLAAARSGDRVEVSVIDGGPGIGQLDRMRATKRFVRLEKSRSKPGTGLGLSLVAAVAKLHAGSLRFEDNHPGLRAILSLPADHVAQGSGKMADR
jgi:signal transduction histidine kinase